MYYRQKKYVEALEYYQTSLKYMPNSPIILANIAYCQMDMGKTEEGLATFK